MASRAGLRRGNPKHNILVSSSTRSASRSCSVPATAGSGTTTFFLQDIPHTYTYGGSFDTGLAFLAFFLGAMVGRTSFKGDLLYSLAASGFIEPARFRSERFGQAPARYARQPPDAVISRASSTA